MTDQLHEISALGLLDQVLEQLREIKTVLERAQSKGSLVAKIAASAQSQEFVPRRGWRHRLFIFNDASTTLLVKLGPLANPDDFTFSIAAGASWEAPGAYAGVVTGVWSGAPTGQARVTELM